MFLEVENLIKYYGEGENRMQVLKGISTGVEKGEMCVIQGPSGSGKSTFLHCIGGLEIPDGGSIKVDGTQIVGMNQSKLSDYRRDKLGFIFQFYNLVPDLKYPDRKVPEGGTPAFAKTLNKERFGYNLEVTLLGTDTENPYFDAVVPKGRKDAAISSAMAQKYDIKKGETVVLEDREAEQYYAFRVDSIVQYSPGFTVFMDIEEMRKMFGEDEDYFNVVYSDHELPVDSGKLFSVVTRSQIEQSGHVFVDLMASMVYTMTGVSAFISNVACGMDLTMSPLVYVGLFVIITAMYFVINAMLVRRIDKVTPAQVLKNRE